ncbi:winged helix-turn-helix transcriptional regulator [Lactobacillus gasseri]|nr:MULTISPECIES: winged helix-turn-helix transcriptional regulator [Lactobacillaceae]MCZ3509396.1 winged helix-turn-helix transcriptional regulator [Lactobacillus gasseri]
MTRFGETLTPIILEMDKWGQTYNSINSEDSN